MGAPPLPPEVQRQVTAAAVVASTSSGVEVADTRRPMRLTKDEIAKLTAAFGHELARRLGPRRARA